MKKINLMTKINILSKNSRSFKINILKIFDIFQCKTERISKVVELVYEL